MAGRPNHEGKSKRRLAAAFAVAAVALLAFSLNAWLAQQSQFVLWTSPPVGKSGRHVKALIPSGWKLSQLSQINGGIWEEPKDSKPEWLQRLLPHKASRGAVCLDVGPSRVGINWGVSAEEVAGSMARLVRPMLGNVSETHRTVTSREGDISASILYYTDNKDQFDSLHETIRDSLKIE